MARPKTEVAKLREMYDYLQSHSQRETAAQFSTSLRTVAKAKKLFEEFGGNPDLIPSEPVKLKETTTINKKTEIVRLDDLDEEEHNELMESIEPIQSKSYSSVKCAICGAELSNNESRIIGIGPVCRSHPIPEQKEDPLKKHLEYWAWLSEQKKGQLSKSELEAANYLISGKSARGSVPDLKRKLMKSLQNLPDEDPIEEIPKIQPKAESIPSFDEEIEEEINYNEFDEFPELDKEIEAFHSPKIELPIKKEPKKVYIDDSFSRDKEKVSKYRRTFPDGLRSDENGYYFMEGDSAAQDWFDRKSGDAEWTLSPADTKKN